MLYLKKFLDLITTIFMAVGGVMFCILYSLFWLVVLLICLPVLLVIALPLLLIAVPTGAIMMHKGLTVLDEDV